MSGPEIPLTFELSQLLSAVVNNAQAGQRFLTADPPCTKEALEAFADIVADGKRADDAIRRLRELLGEDGKGSGAAD